MLVAGAYLIVGHHIGQEGIIKVWNTTTGASHMLPGHKVGEGGGGLPARPPGWLARMQPRRGGGAQLYYALHFLPAAGWSRSHAGLAVHGLGLT
jgi:hypothetical protein